MPSSILWIWARICTAVCNRSCVLVSKNADRKNSEIPVAFKKGIKFPQTSLGKGFYLKNTK